uniref:Isopenicillin N synthase n=1 Tax=Candidatus Kentrum sp. UNK TaxID=2126344 RepID=A0A451B130_9GAMM|nr:MAG: hypothetical protein BECKUNK1418G_GA0071005_10895 [Candidatus Kentron sp. UNK]VFK71988.1 MAG: hypothetical protein BECKUNK1418H_GA0071006_10905 [Candidatus Kentron sp. UNK]
MSEKKAAPNSTGNPRPTPVRIDFDSLISTDIRADISESVEKAFGLDGFGGAIITNIPGFKETREKVLKNMYRLSKEPKEFLRSLSKTDVSGLHEVGWTDKEMKAPFGKITNKPVAFYSRYPQETVVFPQDPGFEKVMENIWPEAIPQFKEDLFKLNSLLTPPFLGLLKYLDRYLSGKVDDDKRGKFVDSFFDHYGCSSRLIVYKPLDEFQTNAEDEYNWENWHVDHCLMTAVTHPIYLTRQGERYELDSTALLLKDRRGQEHEGVFSEDEFILTTGNPMFVESAGYIPATPHTVKLSRGMPKDIYRIQSAYFFEPDMNYRMNIPTGESFEEILARDPTRHSHRESDFFEEGCYYKEFLDEIGKFIYK